MTDPLPPCPAHTFLKPKQELKEVIDKGNCAPIMVRLAWHDAGTFDVAKKDKPFPAVRDSASVCVWRGTDNPPKRHTHPHTRS